MVNIIIQARTGSKRLPRKVIKNIFRGRTILGIVIDRCQLTGYDVIVATTKKSEDDIIEQIAIKHNAKCFRGSEDNVLLRFINCGLIYRDPEIIRVCGDNPLIDPELIRVTYAIGNSCDYASIYVDGENSISKKIGIFAEYVGIDALIKSYTTMIQGLPSTKDYEEHVTKFIYNNPKEFDIEKIELTYPFKLLPKLSIDYEADLKQVREIFNHFKKYSVNYRELFRYFDMEW